MGNSVRFLLYQLRRWIMIYKSQKKKKRKKRNYVYEIVTRCYSLKVEELRITKQSSG